MFSKKQKTTPEFELWNMYPSGPEPSSITTSGSIVQDAITAPTIAAAKASQILAIYVRQI